ncbi:MAG: ABC transporter ATP-binding protein [Phycisphaerales bacterium]
MHPADPTPADHPLLRFAGLRKSFGTLRVLEGLDLDIYKGQTTVVLGPSGSGKSVLLKHAVGLLEPDAGRVEFDGQRVDTLKEHEWWPVRRRIGFLFQMAALFDSMTVRENLDFPLRELTDMTRRERLEAVAVALHRVDLHDVDKKYPAQLSGGQRKRVGLARAIILEPELVLYDEPTTGLDPLRAAGIDALINKLKDELGVTSLVVTHDLVSAHRVADRAVLLWDGVVRADGTLDELRSSEDPIVSGFMTANEGKATTLKALDAAEGTGAR